MGTVLKLVKASPVEDRSRPFRTVYYDCAKPTSVTMFKRIGHARTQAGALKAATIKLANGTFARLTSTTTSELACTGFGSTARSWRSVARFTM